MKLFCLLLDGATNSKVFSVNMTQLDDTIDDLKTSIRAKADLSVLAHDLDLLLARTEEQGWPADAARVHDLDLNALTMLNPTSRLNNVFGADPPEEVIHVLVKLPEDEQSRLIMAQLQKQQVVCEMKAMVEEAEKAKRKAERAEEARRREEERVARIPRKRKHDWDELNDVLDLKQGKNGRAAFSAVEYESLPKRYRVDVRADVRSGDFYDLITRDQRIDDNVLDDIMKMIEVKTQAYQTYTANEATRVQFMSAIFEYVVYMFRKEEKGDEDMALEIQSKLTGTYVRANGVVDFLIRRGKKQVCVVEAKDENFRKGSAQSVLGMEVAAELNEEECVYGVVTNYNEWRFLKRTDEAIEQYTDVNSSSREDIRRIAGRLYAILDD